MTGSVCSCTLRQSRAWQTGQHVALDEMFVKLQSEPYALWCAMDEHGTELNVLLTKDYISDVYAGIPGHETQ